MNYEAWEASIPGAIKGDALWTVNKSRHIVGDAVTAHRIDLLTENIRLLLTMIPDKRGRTMHEQPGNYQSEDDSTPNSNGST